MASLLTHAVLALGATSWLSFTCATATTIISPTFEELADRADLVFVGKVAGSRAEWRSSGTKRVILSLIEFELEEVLKGSAGTSVTLQFLGGTVGDVTLEVASVPRFNPGERVLLFVEGNGIQFCPLVGVCHGKFGLRKEEKSGRDIVLLHDGKPLRDVAEIGAGEDAKFGPNRARSSSPGDQERMSLDAFKRRIRSHLASKAAR
jgi:hypothetical protein